MTGHSLIIREQEIDTTLAEARAPGSARVREILAKAGEMKGLAPADVAVLMQVTTPDLLQELFDTARRVKRDIYGNRLVLFAPLYISNLCANECLYCAFRARNQAIVRRALTQEEIAQEVKILIDQGHKRVLVVAGESYPHEGFQYVLDSIATAYSVKSGPGEIRRVNANVAPLTLDEFRRLKDARIGTYQLFQETYHRATYGQVHLSGRKQDYDWRITAMDRAMEAGINDVGIGILFGLADWRFELLALLQHSAHLEQRFGVGPHTISVPRLEPATGSDMASSPPHAVTDEDFRKIVAILRLAVPYTGIILSTRENPAIRRESLALGVSQISAGSRTNPGGYADAEGPAAEGQFSLGDHRELDEVIRDVSSLGYIPSFCTGCYRLGRTGKDFMDLAKPGEIKRHCDPNAVSTFMEYLIDYATPATRAEGELRIEQAVLGMDPGPQATARKLLGMVRGGKRDAYC
jgi:2-iminoacetate synthase